MLTDLRRSLLAAAAAAAALVVAAPAASADSYGSGTSTGGGYEVTASVTFSGDAAPAGGGTVSRGVPATCWWEAPYEAPSGDAAAMVGWFQDRVREYTITFSGWRGVYGSLEDWEAAAAAEAAGADLTWYVAHCAETDVGRLAGFAGQGTFASPSGPAVVQYAAFPAGAPPAPQVDPAALAELARDEMVVPDPEVDRNPRSSGLGATFVGLPTWFWVTDPDAVGGDTGTRTIRAQVGSVWAEVTATTGGLSVSSPAGAETCSPERARTAWAPGLPESAGCTVTFTRSSAAFPGGMPLDLSTTWSAAYTASDGSGGDLEGLVRTADDAVPVAESQALVTASR
ncbi:hypothetical protein WDZ16_11800 [Pseudokineococcus marinus]|uniref:Uncharacterized protein n=1 Tax=Pseudokineococcus marinus TaxID=351215 RepID=A0A849BGS6_9ACTN|nr:hypothetical protein [Pseudokineococcus marinus]NNH22310.1 hypothetical protein [Pseudokineococcus marinus]